MSDKLRKLVRNKRKMEEVGHTNPADIANEIDKLRKENEELKKQLASVSKTMHYPECWCTAAYPTLEDAVIEVFSCANKEAHEHKDT